MKLYDTLTGTLQPLLRSDSPLPRPGERGPGGEGLRMYVCGVTPYAESHIGHAMSAIVYDVLVRYLRWPGNPAGGLDVTYVSNYTDVDDKLIDRAAELRVDALALAEQQIALWEQQQHALNLLPPDVRPRVTREIPAIVALIERLVAGGHAYATLAGDVYFRVRADADYGKLSHRNIDDLRAGTRFDVKEQKEFPLDFALWKAPPPEGAAGEPQWDSPWGLGRPGWHIECSAMAQRYLGDSIDIHGGGLDLVFPHHENEIAQSESATARPFARIWMHNGLVQRDGEKMSKSLGNVVTVADALARWSPDALRLFVLNSHYRSPNNVTDEAMAAATRAVGRLQVALRPAGPAGSASPLPPGEGLGVRGPADTRACFVAALEDDLNTAQALAALFDLVRDINRARAEGADVAEAQSHLRELAGVLGLTLDAPSDVDASATLDAAQFSKLAKQHAVACGDPDVASTIDALLAARTGARAARDFARADAIRADLAAAGIDIEDTPEGPRWSVRR
ncbi:MAG: cysteine--tRNA ligase [Chloroflexi bacterium]|nr:cysteine--tRNA ligase [Chloroflexota bacterium]